MNGRPDAPYKRVYENGRELWVARYTDPTTGERKYAKPSWNRGKSTFAYKRDAQRAIQEAQRESLLPPPPPIIRVGEYADRWFSQHPRAESTNATNRARLAVALPVPVGGQPLRDWALDAVRRPQAHAVVDHLLREGRSLTGTRNVLATLSAMWSDAVGEDLLAEVNPFWRLKLRANDPRIQKHPEPKQVWTIDQMRSFANWGRSVAEEAMIRLMCDCGLRLGEVLGLRRQDLDLVAGYVHVRGTAYRGRFVAGDAPRKRHVRSVPIPSDTRMLLARVPPRLDTDVMFPTPSGTIYQHRNFYRDVWYPIRELSGLDITPHGMRHSWESALAKAGVDHADLAAVAGHSLETMLRVYVHPLGQSDDAIREALDG